MLPTITMMASDERTGRAARAVLGRVKAKGFNLTQARQVVRPELVSEQDADPRQVVGSRGDGSATSAARPPLFSFADRFPI